MIPVGSSPRPRQVTVVIAAYNQTETLEQTIISATSQHGDVEVRVVVVVDACPHGTEIVARQAAAMQPDKVSVIELDTNVGQAGARDIGLRSVTSPWVLFLDGDDTLRPDALSVILDRAAKESTARAILGRIVKMGRDGSPLAPDRRELEVGHHQVISWFRPRPSRLSIRSFLTDFRVGPPGCWLLDAQLVREVGGFDPALRSNEDLEFMARLLALTQPIEIDHVVLTTRMHHEQQTADAALQRRTHRAALWRVLRRSSTNRPDVVRGIVGCYEFRARKVLTYGSPTRVPKAVAWAACSMLVRPICWAEATLRAVRGPMGPPDHPVT